MLEIANEYADNNDIIMWTNSDIIYTKSLLKTIIEFKKFKIKDYLLVGQRLDWGKYKEIELNKKNLIEIINNSKFHVPCGIDYFIHSKTSLLNNFDKKLSMPAICGDQKLLNSGIKKNIFTCDCTQTILAIHQDLGRENRESDYFKKVKKNNLDCKGGWSNIKQCKFISFYFNKEIKFKLRRDINWYENRLNENFKKQIKFLEKKIKKILILNL